MGVDMAQTNAATMLVQVAETGGLGWTPYLPLNRCVSTTFKFMCMCMFVFVFVFMFTAIQSFIALVSDAYPLIRLFAPLLTHPLPPSIHPSFPRSADLIDMTGARPSLGALPEMGAWIGQGAGGAGRSVLAAEVQRQEQRRDALNARDGVPTPHTDPVVENTAKTDLDRVGSRSLAANKSEDEVLPQACELRAFHLFLACAEQGRADAHIKVGDFYYYGRAGLVADGPAAATRYKLAADLRHPHAIFNLGLMYEAGAGVKQDFHLAKRFYDQVRRER